MYKRSINCPALSEGNAILVLVLPPTRSSEEKELRRTSEPINDKRYERKTSGRLTESRSRSIHDLHSVSYL